MGMITEIQRFSLHDGPGIRTTVFFKGCNLSCTWCHNPETIASAVQVLVSAEKCVKCGACLEHGDEGAQVVLPLPYAALTPEKAARCIFGALTVAGREVSIEDVLAEIDLDAAYFTASDGGVTLSGGEAMMQPEFVLGLLKACKQRNYHTALETNLAYSWDELTPLLPFLDLMIADIKSIDNDIHKKEVGVSNTAILRNVGKLASSAIAYIIRTPVIPGVNATEQAIASIAKYISKNADHLLYYELLNFNALGASKYAALQTKNRFQGVSPLTEAEMDRLKAAAVTAGVPVRVG